MSTWSSYSSFWGLPDIFFLLFSASLTTSTILLKVGFLTPVFLLNWASLSLFICVYMPLFYRGTGTFERGLIDKVNINELGMRQKLEDEIRRFNKLQKIVNGKSGNELVEENDVNIRQYAKYLLKDGSTSDKRELLANLRSRLNYKDKKISLIEE